MDQFNKKKSRAKESLKSSLSWLCAIAGNDLDLVCGDRLVFEPKVGILEYKSPDFVTETICMQVSLCRQQWSGGVEQKENQP